ncbi:hypothetical protein D3Y59_02775 [Hymenobacter oligotrophus]|uniref:Uncharacterized protein n=1 Tax=Hymenobacter oligotrophus TaxID=2319843 RepID=A0A3B7QX06_9BACT|nr:hypothetical protein [Hymenobacter oligotrophus]AYA36075.1 hypothetical protein D3Y59_02775 [Hymenobacter oligotrophus]
MNRQEKGFMLLALSLFVISLAGRAGHWLHAGVAPTLVLFGLTFVLAAVARYNRRLNLAKQPQLPPAPPAAL